MSIMRCTKHDVFWDSDFLDECPSCSNEDEDSGDYASDFIIGVKQRDAHELELLVSEFEMRFTAHPRTAAKSHL